MLNEYIKHVKQRKELELPPLPLNAEQTSALTEMIINPPDNKKEFLLDLITNRIPPGVDEAASIKAKFLYSLCKEEKTSPIIDKKTAITLLGTMLGGYNSNYLIELLDIDELAEEASKSLSNILLILDRFNDILLKAENNKFASDVLQSWANAEWFTKRPLIPEKITMTVFKVDGEINTDDFSPASEAWSRPDIPLHARSMLINRIENPLNIIKDLKTKGYPIAFVGDVVGTGSSRKSAGNSLLWHIGNDIPFVPNKKAGGIVLGGKIAPIFFNTMEDAGALPIECDVTNLKNGDIINIYPHEGKIFDETDKKLITNFTLKTKMLLDEVRAGGRIPLIIGRTLTDKTRKALNLGDSDIFQNIIKEDNATAGFTLAQKIIGKACNKEGVRPGDYCEPIISSVGSQDTTGPMTRDELKELACLNFSSDLVMQSFCHTAAYPKKIDIEMHKTMPDFFTSRGGVALNPGDGVIHSWLNRMILPDTVGTGGDSHTRFPIGISFPAGSGLVAFGAAMGIMPIDIPESVLIKFSGKMQPYITLRDIVNAIPYIAIKKNLLTVEKEGKKNIFSGKIIEIQGLPNLTVEEAFELSDSSAERSAAACTVELNEEPVIKFLNSNIALLKALISKGYQNSDSLLKRVNTMQSWIESPKLLKSDKNAKYNCIIDIDLNTINEPILACPNDPDDVRLLSELQGIKVDQVFIGSCMTNIGHFRACAKLLEGRKHLSTRLSIAPPTKMDSNKLKNEGLYSIFGQAGVGIELSGCSFCMGNQARTAKDSTVISTSTRNFPNRMGDNTDVCLGSAELATICAILGKIPSFDEYKKYMKIIKKDSSQIYKYMDFSDPDCDPMELIS